MLRGANQLLTPAMEATVLQSVNKFLKTAAHKFQCRNRHKTASKCLSRNASRWQCKCLIRNAHKFQNKTAPRCQSKKQFKFQNSIASKFQRSTARVSLFKRPSFKLEEFPKRFVAMDRVEGAEGAEVVEEMEADIMAEEVVEEMEADIMENSRTEKFRIDRF